MSQIYGDTEYGCKIYTACNGGEDDIDLHNLISKLITSIEATGVQEIDKQTSLIEYKSTKTAKNTEVWSMYLLKVRSHGGYDICGGHRVPKDADTMETQGLQRDAHERGKM